MGRTGPGLWRIPFGLSSTGHLNSLSKEQNRPQIFLGLPLHVPPQINWGSKVIEATQGGVSPTEGLPYFSRIPSAPSFLLLSPLL